MDSLVVCHDGRDVGGCVRHSRVYCVAFDEHTDSRELVGQWVCNGGGDFVWKAGLLRRAVEDGACLLVEGLEHCSEDVVAKLEQVRKQRRIETDPRQVDFVPAHQDFCIVLAHKYFGEHCNGPVVKAPDDEPLRHPLLKNVALLPVLNINSTGSEDRYGTRLKISRLIRHWHRVCLAPVNVDRAVSRAPKVFHSVMKSVVAMVYNECVPLFDPASNGGFRSVARLATLPTILFKQKMKKGRLLYFIRVLRRYEKGLRTLQHWPELANIPEGHRLQLGCVIMITLFSHLPHVVREIVVDFVVLPFLGFSHAAGSSPTGSSSCSMRRQLLYPVLPEPLFDVSKVGLVPNRVQNSVVSTCVRALSSGRHCLLVGSAGGGKTAIAKALAKGAGKELFVFNCHDQAESGELVGDLVPLNVESLLTRLLHKLLADLKNRAEMAEGLRELEAIEMSIQPRRDLLVNLVKQLIGFMPNEEAEQWKTELAEIEAVKGVRSEFREGLLLQAIRTGSWLLLDEINLCPAGVLSRVIPLLHGGDSVHYTVFENGGELVPVHPGFRIIGSMNPPMPVDHLGNISVGDHDSSLVSHKKQLPDTVRDSFIEVYLDEIHDLEDIEAIASACLPLAKHSRLVAESFNLLKNVINGRRDKSQVTTVLSVGGKGCSLRTLSRVLKFVERRILGAKGDSLRYYVEGMLLFCGSTHPDSDKVMLQLLSSFLPQQVKEYQGIEDRALNCLPLYDGRTAFHEFVRNLRPKVELVTQKNARYDAAGSSVPGACGTRKLGADDCVVGALIEDQFFIPTGEHPFDYESACREFLCPRSVKLLMRKLMRLIQGSMTPILLEGATSVGKTSLVEFLCRLTHNEFIRINNHDQITMSEYVGCYVPDSTGTFSFQIGPLLKAVQDGSWVVLDEYNLAPQEVLEGLNRLLDDNRELFVPELDRTFKAHPNFRMFATQNPSSYGGRKVLTEAIQSRFVQLHVTEHDADSLLLILLGRCPDISPAIARTMIAVYEKCRVLRGNNAFDVLITIRDLLRWSKFNPLEKPDDLIRSGMIVIGERLRSSEQRQDFHDTISSIIRPKKCPKATAIQYDIRDAESYEQIAGLSMTYSMKRLLSLVQWSWEFNEPLLLVGVTGCGKTAVINAVSQLTSLKLTGDVAKRGLITINCQQNTEVSDFIGGFRPAMVTQEDVKNILAAWKSLLDVVETLPTYTQDIKKAYKDLTARYEEQELLNQNVSRYIDQFGKESLALAEPCCVSRHDLVTIKSLLEDCKLAIQPQTSHQPPTASSSAPVAAQKEGVSSSREKLLSDDEQGVTNAADLKRVYTESYRKFNDAYDELLKLISLGTRAFTWQDGPLVRAMVEGRPFLIDEINLADDAVIERLNSVLEGSRFLRVNDRMDPVIRAHPDFRIFATMNPGGDFGKKELSKAMRNRFFEVYVDRVQFTDPSCVKIVHDRLRRIFRSEHHSERDKTLIHLLTKIGIDVLVYLEQICVNEISIREIVTWLDCTGRIFKSTHELQDKNSTYVPEDFEACFRALLHALWATILDGFEISHRSTNTPPSFLLADCLSNLPEPSNPQACIVLKTLASIHEVTQQAIAHSDAAAGAVNVSKLAQEFYPDGLGWMHDTTVQCCTGLLRLGPFRLEPKSYTGELPNQATGISNGAVNQSRMDLVAYRGLTMDSRTTVENLGRVLRAMHAPQPVLLEGSPGVGKTALVQWLASVSQRRLYRFNLNEQTDIGELVGSFAPEESSFKWKAGGLTEALLNGDWVLLDEINLAPQPVLEGLNSLLDFRRCVFIPELNKTVFPRPGFRLFAAQNRQADGGGRKSLPRSFLNRFAKLIVNTLTQEDQIAILHSLSPDSDELWRRIVVQALADLKAVRVPKAVAYLESRWLHRLSGSWEWNARDCQRIQAVGKWLRERFGWEGSRLWRLAFDLVFYRRFTHGKDRAVYRAIMDEYLPWTPWPSQQQLIATTGNSIASSALRPSTLKSRCLKSLTEVQAQCLLPVVASIAANQPVLLSGGPLEGKITLVHAAASILGLITEVMHMTPMTDSSDLMGSYIREGEVLRWAPSVLCRTVESGGILALVGVEHAEAGVVDRLNGLLERHGYLTFSDGGQFRRLKPHPDFRIVLLAATEYPVSLSPAVRNRCIEVSVQLPVVGGVERKRTPLNEIIGSMIRKNSGTRNDDVFGRLKIITESGCQVALHIARSTGLLKGRDNEDITELHSLFELGDLSSWLALDNSVKNILPPKLLAILPSRFCYRIFIINLVMMMLSLTDAPFISQAHVCATAESATAESATARKIDRHGMLNFIQQRLIQLAKENVVSDCMFDSVWKAAMAFQIPDEEAMIFDNILRLRQGTRGSFAEELRRLYNAAGATRSGIHGNNRVNTTIAESGSDETGPVDGKLTPERILPGDVLASEEVFERVAVFSGDDIPTTAKCHVNSLSRFDIDPNLMRNRIAAEEALTSCSGGALIELFASEGRKLKVDERLMALVDLMSLGRLSVELERVRKLVALQRNTLPASSDACSDAVVEAADLYVIRQTSLLDVLAPPVADMEAYHSEEIVLGAKFQTWVYVFANLNQSLLEALYPSETCLQVLRTMVLSCPECPSDEKADTSSAELAGSWQLLRSVVRSYFTRCESNMWGLVQVAGSTVEGIAGTETLQKGFGRWLHQRLGNYTETEIESLRELLKSLQTPEPGEAAVAAIIEECRAMGEGPSDDAVKQDGAACTSTSWDSFLAMRQELERIDAWTLPPSVIARVSRETRVLQCVTHFAVTTLDMENDEQNYQPTAIEPPADPLTGIAVNWKALR
ncbi:putative midasin [Gregarina niphandrodes]|uniref:Midasin n=1 Tax=Gregarina niphandrodes TaxID=110365 RepID=A0A023AYT4_GRENI|nr:putative midasin [Gregarina niphandrodes]EZG43826.1 putative midasin [Gregarina niphandrodes]|eukprot:XP_011132981.1 putative midasin [Gregarina niphandrodes]